MWLTIVMRYTNTSMRNTTINTKTLPPSSRITFIFLCDTLFPVLQVFMKEMRHIVRISSDCRIGLNFNHGVLIQSRSKHWKILYTQWPIEKRFSVGRVNWIGFWKWKAVTGGLCYPMPPGNCDNYFLSLSLSLPLSAFKIFTSLFCQSELNNRCFAVVKSVRDADKVTAYCIDRTLVSARITGFALAQSKWL
jgi:hypothetical protein